MRIPLSSHPAKVLLRLVVVTGYVWIACNSVSSSAQVSQFHWKSFNRMTERLPADDITHLTIGDDFTAMLHKGYVCRSWTNGLQVVGYTSQFRSGVDYKCIIDGPDAHILIDSTLYFNFPYADSTKVHHIIDATMKIAAVNELYYCVDSSLYHLVNAVVSKVNTDKVYFERIEYLYDRLYAIIRNVGLCVSQDQGLTWKLLHTLSRLAELSAFTAADSTVLYRFDPTYCRQGMCSYLLTDIRNDQTTVLHVPLRQITSDRERIRVSQVIVQGKAMLWHELIEDTVANSVTASEIIRTTDRGYHWDFIQMPLKPMQLSAFRKQVALTDAQSAFLSDDAGLHWYDVSQTLDTANCTRLSGTPMCGCHYSAVYAYGDTQVFQNIPDTNYTWTCVHAPYATNRVVDVSEQIFDYYGSNNYSYTTYLTSDGSFNIERSDPWDQRTFLYGGRVDSACRRLSMMPGANIQNLVGWTSRDVLLTNDGGKHWARSTVGDLRTRIADLLAFETGLYVATNNGIYVSHDAGVHWTQCALSGIAVHSLSVGQDPFLNVSCIFASSTDGMYRREDNDYVWYQSAFAGQSVQRTIAVQIRATSSATEYVALVNGKPYYSTIPDSVWTPLVTGLDSSFIVNDIWADRNLLLCAVAGHGVYTIARNTASSVAQQDPNQETPPQVLELRPQPVNDCLTAVLPARAAWSVALYNPEGTCVQAMTSGPEQNELMFSLSGVPNGVYVVEARSADKTLYSRCVVCH